MKLPPNYVKKEKVNDEQKNEEELQVNIYFFK
jgi:hypothetical protein